MSGSPSRLLRSVPDEWGPKFETSSGAVTRTLTGPNSIRFNAPSHMALVMLTPQPGREVSLNSDRRSRFLAPVGAVEIIPSNAEVFARWKSAKENLLLALAPEQLSRLAAWSWRRRIRVPVSGAGTCRREGALAGQVDPGRVSKRRTVEPSLYGFPDDGLLDLSPAQLFVASRSSRAPKKGWTAAQGLPGRSGLHQGQYWRAVVGRATGIGRGSLAEPFPARLQADGRPGASSICPCEPPRAGRAACHDDRYAPGKGRHAHRFCQSQSHDRVDAAAQIHDAKRAEACRCRPLKRSGFEIKDQACERISGRSNFWRRQRQ